MSMDKSLEVAKLFVISVLLLATGSATSGEKTASKRNLPPCKGVYDSTWNNCSGELSVLGDKYVGGFKNGKMHGNGIYVYSYGTIYVGGYKDGIWHGHGKLTQLDGYEYVGFWDEGKKSGEGEEHLKNGDKYKGWFKDGTYEGTGIYTFRNGSKYEGSFRNGMREGYGVLIFPTGSSYDGHWHNDEMHGYGMYKFPNGDQYAGEFKKNERNGYGSSILTNGGAYTGYWKDSQMHGQGILQYSSGEKTEGVFLNGKIHLAKKVKLTNPNNFPPCPKANTNKSKDKEKPFEWNNCWGLFRYENKFSLKRGDVYEGEWRNGLKHGLGTYYWSFGQKYVGQWKSDKADGYGRLTTANGDIYVGSVREFLRSGFGINISASGDRTEGLWENDVLVTPGKVNLHEINHLLNSDDGSFTNEFKSKDKSLFLTVNYSPPQQDGKFFINIQTGVDTASLMINGEEQGGRADGRYSINKVARAGQDTEFSIVATDVNGNTETKTITVNRPIDESKVKFAALNPSQLKKQPERDAVAIIIGIADYKNLPRADFANDDASVFYDYAVRALGVKPENIKLLVDGNADDVAIYQAFKTWLPSRVRSTTDVYVYYSGHGLPAEDGQGLYLLPQRAHRDLIEKTAINQREINGFIQAAKPRSVTIFLDSCYSGLARTGETLLASARPLALKVDKKVFPDEFTVITASQADQISSSSPDLKHGIFSYYLMRGMEGEADANRDGKITIGEMHGYLAEQVARQAGMMNRRQEPQLIGDANRVLIAK